MTTAGLKGYVQGRFAGPCSTELARVAVGCTHLPGTGHRNNEF